MSVKLLTEHHLDCFSLKEGFKGSSKSKHVKMPHCWKSYALAHVSYMPVATAHPHRLFRAFISARSQEVGA